MWRQVWYYMNALSIRNTLGAKFSRFVVILFKIHGMENIIYDYEISCVN